MTALLATYCVTRLFFHRPSEGVNIFVTLLTGIACAALLRGAAVGMGELWPTLGLGADAILFIGVLGAASAILRHQLHEESKNE